MGDAVVSMNDRNIYRNAGGENQIASEVLGKSLRVAKRFMKCIESIKECFPPLPGIQYDEEEVEIIKPDRVFKYRNIIIKREDFYEEDLIREAVIGLILNQIIGKDSFVHTIGYHIATSNVCEAPSNVCEAPFSDCVYLYTTEINGRTLTEWLENAFTYKDFKKILVKVFRTLYRANQELDFTHYDLHPDNIIISYSESDKNQDPQATIIDLGSAHIKYEGGHMGMSRLEKHCILNYASFWVCDVFKLLICCTDKLAKSKTQSEEQALGIKLLFNLLSYFNKSITDFSWINQYLLENTHCQVYMTETNKDTSFKEFLDWAESIILS